MPILDNTALVIAVLVLLLLPIIYFHILDVNGDVGYVALVVGIATVLYARKSMILDVRMKHTADVHKFLQEWLGLLERRQTQLVQLLPTLRAPFYRSDTYTAEYGLWPMTDHALYKDLLNNHIPEEHRKFLNEWEKYKKSTEAYEDSCWLLYGELVKGIRKSLEKSNIELSEKYEADRFVVTTNYVKFVYVAYIEQIVHNRIQRPRTAILPYNVNNKTLQRLVAYSDDQQEYQLANGTEQQMKKVEEEFLEDVGKPVKKYSEGLKGYHDARGNVMSIEKNITDGYRDQVIFYVPCMKSLKDMLNYPVLSGTSCYILKKI